MALVIIGIFIVLLGGFGWFQLHEGIHEGDGGMGSAMVSFLAWALAFLLVIVWTVLAFHRWG